MKGGVAREVWRRAQTGHLETWHAYARRGEQRSPERAALWKSILSEVEQQRPFAPGERVLDIGCGLDSVLDYTEGVKGYTLDSLMGQLHPLGLSDDLRHTAGLLEAVPFDEASFDRVFLLNVLDHVRAPHQGLREIARILRPGGMLFLSVDVYAGRRYWVKRARKFYDRLRGARTKHPWVFSAADIDRILRGVGLRPRHSVHVPGTKARRLFFSAERS